MYILLIYHWTKTGISSFHKYRISCIFHGEGGIGQDKISTEILPYPVYVSYPGLFMLRKFDISSIRKFKLLSSVCHVFGIQQHCPSCWLWWQVYFSVLIVRDQQQFTETFANRYAGTGSQPVGTGSHQRSVDSPVCIACYIVIIKLITWNKVKPPIPAMLCI